MKVGPRLLGMLEDLRAVASEHGDTHGRLIFPNQHGEPRNRTDVSRRLHRDALRRAGLRQTIWLHDLRHSAAVAWIAAGMPLLYGARQLGHASITTTEHYYGHLAETHLDDAIGRVEAITAPVVTRA